MKDKFCGVLMVAEQTIMRCIEYKEEVRISYSIYIIFSQLPPLQRDW